MERGLVESWRLWDIRVIRSFKSRRNNVYLVRTEGERCGSRKVVIKHYPGRPECRAREASLLRMLGSEGPRVPVLYYEGREMIALEYVRGRPLVDFLECEEGRDPDGGPHQGVRSVLRDLVDWFDAFYRVLAVRGEPYLIVGDVNMRNYIVGEDGITGLDLEQARPGRRVQDIGRLCAYALTYDPAFTGWKRELVLEMVDGFCSSLGLDRLWLRQELKRGLEEIGARRGFDVPVAWLRFAGSV